LSEGGGSWYFDLSWGGCLCFSTCPGDGEVKKYAACPMKIISAAAFTNVCVQYNYLCQF